MASTVFHESYGNVTRAQLAAYRKYNVSPSDHDTLVEVLGEEQHDDIKRCVKELAEANEGFYNPRYSDIRDWHKH